MKRRWWCSRGFLHSPSCRLHLPALYTFPWWASTSQGTKCLSLRRRRPARRRPATEWRRWRTCGKPAELVVVPSRTPLFSGGSRGQFNGVNLLLPAFNLTYRQMLVLTPVDCKQLQRAHSRERRGVTGGARDANVRAEQLAERWGQDDKYLCLSSCPHRSFPVDHSQTYNLGGMDHFQHRRRLRAGIFEGHDVDTATAGPLTVLIQMRGAVGHALPVGRPAGMNIDKVPPKTTRDQKIDRRR